MPTTATLSRHAVRPERAAAEILAKYRGKIVEQFYPARGEAKLRLGEARKAVRDYRKATGNLPGTAELLMTFVEQGAEFTHDYGDIDERFYNSVESALDELAALLHGEARGVYPQLSERLARVEQITDRIGWGFHDHIGGRRVAGGRARRSVTSTSAGFPIATLDKRNRALFILAVTAFVRLRP